jgi:tetratricopeptide (TPR) repeat protein
MDAVNLSRSIELIVGMLLGGMICWLGYHLFEIGVSGKASLSAERGKVKFQLLNASPGIFFGLFGCVLIYASISKTAVFHSKPAPGGGVEISLQRGDPLTTSKDSLARLNATLYAQGKTSYDAKAPGTAEAAFLALVEGNSMYPDACNALAWIYVEEGKMVERAVTLAETAAAARPERIEFLHTLGVAYKQAGRRDEAIATLERALKLDPLNERVKSDLKGLKPD